MNNEERERFISRNIEINVDGIQEIWKVDKIYTINDRMYVRYKLKERNVYETDKR